MANGSDDDFKINRETLFLATLNELNQGGLIMEDDDKIFLRSIVNEIVDDQELIEPGIGSMHRLNHEPDEVVAVFLWKRWGVNLIQSLEGLLTDAQIRAHGREISYVEGCRLRDGFKRELYSSLNRRRSLEIDQRSKPEGNR